MHHPSELGRQRPAREAVRQVLVDLAGGEEPERQVLAAAMHVELLLQRTQRMLAHEEIGGTIGRDDDQPGGAAALRQESEQVQGGWIAPVEILDGKDEWCRLRERL